MKFEYPTDSGNSSFLKGASNTMGFYPVGVLNNWHGGIHIEWGTRKIRSVADGYIIAYRLPEKSIRIEKEAGENKEKKKYSYSNGFILIRHQYVSPRGQLLAFYSLYNHLLPKEEYKEREIPACYNEYEVKSASRPKVGIRIWMDNTKNDGRSYFVPKGYIVTVVPDKKAGEGGNFEKGAEYKWVTAKNLQGDVIAEGYIKIGSTYVDVVEEGCYKVKHSGAKKQDEELEVWQDKECTVLLCLLSPGSKVKVTMYDSNLAEVSVGDKTGYVKKPKDNLEAGWESGIKNDEICKCMIPVKAGEFIGFSGPYGCEESPDYRTAHIEVFTDDKKNLDRFLNNECAEGKKMFVKLPDRLGALKYKFLSGTRVEMVTDSENQGSYVQVTVHEAHVKVNRDKDLKKYTATQTYTFDDDDKFASLNNKLKGLLTEKGTVKLVKQPEDQTKEEREDPAVALLPREREVSYASPLAGERFWINRKDLTAVGENGYMIGKRNISNPEVVEVDLYRQKPSENKEKQDISEHIVEISRLKEIVQSDVPDVKWYEVDSSVEDLDENKCGEGFFKIDSGMQFSAFEWGKFGFHLIGDKEDTDRYLYDLSPQPENTLIGYVQSLVDGEQGGQKKNGILEPREFDAVMKDRDKVNKLSRLVCYHRNEWGYDSRLSGLMDEFKASYDALIAEEKEEKYKQRLREKKEECLNELEQKVKDLCFWKAIAGKYERLLTSEKSSSISPDYYEQLRSSAYLNPGIKLSENDGHPQMSETERHVVETFDFPSDPHVCHFHPIAFVEQMKRMNSRNQNVITYEIYQCKAGNVSGKVEKYVPQTNTTQADYYYHDLSGNEYFLGSVTFCKKKWRATSGSEKKKDVEGKDLDYVELTDYSQLASFSSGNVRFKMSPGALESKRYYMDIDALACFVGALLEESIEDLYFSGFSDSEGGTAGGSKSHLNGMVGDMGYLNKNKRPSSTHITLEPNSKFPLLNPDYDYDRQKRFCEALYRFGWARFSGLKLLTENVYEKIDGNNVNKIIPHGKHYVDKASNVRHFHHLHIQGLKLSDILIVKNY